MKTVLKVFAVAACVILVLFAGLSCYIGTQVVNSSTQLVTCEDTTGVSDGFWEKYGMDYDLFTSAYEIEKLELTSSFDGHTIPADYIYAAESNRSMNSSTVVLVHGLGGNRLSNYPLAELFLSKGFNVLTYDQRSSNENTARYTTFGYWEKYDLIDCLEFVREHAPERTVGVWGTSFGGATAGLAMGEEGVEEMVDFLALDCPVSSMRWFVEEEMRNMDLGIPVSYMTFCGDIANHIKLGFGYDEADVPSAVSNIRIPVLVINSEADTLTPQFMGQDIYDAIPSAHKTLWTVEDSDHTAMWLDHNEEYVLHLEQLLELAGN